MNRGRGRGRGRGSGRGRDSGFVYRPRNISSPSADNYAHSKDPVDVGESSDYVQLGEKDYLSHKHGHTSGECTTNTIPKQSDEVPIDLGSLKLENNSSEAEFSCSKQLDCSSKFDNVHLLPNQSDHMENCINVRKSEFSQLSKSIMKGTISKEENECSETSSDKIIHIGRSESSDSPSTMVPFDICLEKTGTPFKLKSPLLVQNREKRNENKRSMEGLNIIELRPGMVLLKRYISCGDQIEIVKTCRQLGLGSGGFYQPVYGDGAKLHLKMMCLGKNWDPETSKYGERRPIDGAKPPLIPSEFHQLIHKALQDTQASLQKMVKRKNVEGTLPSLSPDICIVNFYTNSGRLGLHQDKDESTESLSSGLPVVSISIGDSAEFLYGDQRDIDKPEKVILESGDVLIFGGESRHIFHGVSSILSKTAPEPLLEESNLRPGRLNLTFRKY